MPQRIFFGPGVTQQLRALDQKTAMRISIALTNFLETGDGDTKTLHGYDPPQMRLRVGD